jgi:2OG-Fe(II) oxygenase superfamily
VDRRSGGDIVTRLGTPFPAYSLDDAGAAYGWDLTAVAAEFPAPTDDRWHVFHGAHEPEKRQGGPDCWGPATTTVVLDMVSPGMCAAVASLLGYDVLLADVYGGGMHLSGPGAHLDIHRDFNRHPHTRWRRRANLLLFLNEGWQAGWGGVLELDGTPILPEMGRLVVFECSERSWHGHPAPITDGRWRKSLAAYFYDPSDTVTDGEFHDTAWRDEVAHA